MGRARRRDPHLDRPRGARSSGSTTRTPSRSRSGSGASPSSSADAPRRDLPGRGVHPAEGDVAPRQARASPSRTPTSLALREVAASRRTCTELTSAPVTSTTSGPASGRTRPTSSPTSCSRAAAVFVARLVLAATLTANYGIYGPAFELMRARSRRPRQRGVPRLREVPAAQWDLVAAGLAGAGDPNAQRGRAASHPALQHDRSLRFHRSDNELLSSTSRRPPPSDRRVDVDPRRRQHRHWSTQAGMVHLDLAALGLADGEPYDAARPARRRRTTPGAAIRPTTSRSTLELTRPRVPRSRGPSASANSTGF